MKNYLNFEADIKDLEVELEKLKDVSRILNNIGGRIGNLMDVTEQATSPESQKGTEISTKEKDNIFISKFCYKKYST